MNGAAGTIECSDQPLDFCFHPTQATLLAAALVDGTIEVHDFQELQEYWESGAAKGDDDDDTIVSSTPVHTQLLPTKATSSEIKKASAVAVLFADEGKSLYTGGSAGDLVRLDVEKVCSFQTKATSDTILTRINNASYNQSSIYVLHEIHAPETNSHGLMVSGDDSGGVRVWDPRLMNVAPSTSNKSKRPQGCVYSWKEHEDYISSLGNRDETLLATSADCTLSVYDLRMAQQARQQHIDKEKIVQRSDDQEDELLSLQIIKSGKKVVCGTSEGILSVFSWGQWGDLTDRFPGHPSSLDTMLKVSESTLLTGSSDGLIRYISIHPDKLLGVIGSHDGFPVEKLQFCSNRKYVGSLSHDCLIRLWDASPLHEDYSDDKDSNMIFAPASLGKDDEMVEEADSEDGWEDMDEDEDGDNDDDSDDDDHDKKKPSGRLKTANEKFFEDL